MLWETCFRSVPSFLGVKNSDYIQWVMNKVEWKGKRFDSASSWEIRVLLSFRSCKLQIVTTFHYWEVRSLSLQLIIKDNLMGPSYLYKNSCLRSSTELLAKAFVNYGISVHHVVFVVLSCPRVGRRIMQQTSLRIRLRSCWSRLSIIFCWSFGVLLHVLFHATSLSKSKLQSRWQDLRIQQRHQVF